MKFSIITVALNPGESLAETLHSVFEQTYGNYEVILKDGGSRDGSMDQWKKGGEASPFDRVRYFCEKDTGIYDAMNQAVAHATGEFVVFLNCGDTFADCKVLERVAEQIEASRCEGKAGYDRTVFYGDTISRKLGVPISSPPVITGFTCYRNIPCHQSCFYSLDLCREKPYEPAYKIRADYDHFLWCFYVAEARFIYLEFPVAAYEGGGFSEKAENRRRDQEEHRQITVAYMGALELFRYRLVMALTLAPVRKRLAESKTFSGLYHGCKQWIYRS